MIKQTLSQDQLKQVLIYEPLTGLFRSKICKSKTGALKVVGFVNWKGYILVSVGKRQYRAHRLAWLYMTGQWPAEQVDHENTVKADNRWSNLRLASNRFNQENQVKAPRSNKSCGVLGVTRLPRELLSFQSQIKSKGKNYFLGRYDSAKEAHQAYVEAKRKLHAGCTI